MASSGRRSSLAVVAGATSLALLAGSGPAFSVPNVGAPVLSGQQISTGAMPTSRPQANSSSSSAWASSAFVALAATCAMARRAAVSRSARTEESSEEASRRDVVLPALAAAFAALANQEAAEAQPSGYQAPLPPVDLPDRINADPYELIGMENTEEKKQDYKFFFMKKKYRDDCYQVMKHMKISASLDKGTPNMEKWNKRVKEEMNDWLALYRRQDKVVGRQSYYSLYSAVNTLASHFSSYGPKFPFPNKRRPRFFELVNITEKYLEKGK